MTDEARRATGHAHRCGTQLRPRPQPSGQTRRGRSGVEARRTASSASSTHTSPRSNRATTASSVRARCAPGPGRGDADWPVAAPTSTTPRVLPLTATRTARRCLGDAGAGSAARRLTDAPRAAPSAPLCALGGVTSVSEIRGSDRAPSPAVRLRDSPLDCVVRDADGGWGGCRLRRRAGCAVRGYGSATRSPHFDCVTAVRFDGFYSNGP